MMVKKQPRNRVNPVNEDPTQGWQASLHEQCNTAEVIAVKLLLDYQGWQILQVLTVNMEKIKFYSLFFLVQDNRPLITNKFNMHLFHQSPSASGNRKKRKRSVSRSKKWGHGWRRQAHVYFLVTTGLQKFTRTVRPKKTELLHWQLEECCSLPEHLEDSGPASRKCVFESAI